MIWEGKLRRMTLSESRPKKKKKQRKEYKRQKKKGTIYMALFLFMSSVQFLDLYVKSIVSY